MNKEQVLQQATVDGLIIKLPDVQLDRKVYLEVKKALELIGGKWKGGNTQGFVFSSDPQELLDSIQGEDNLKKDYQFFATPSSLADHIVQLAHIRDGDTILEPSAGQGAILEAINGVTDIVPDCIELMETNRIILNQRFRVGLKGRLIGQEFDHDFMKAPILQYSKIIANPPFTKNQDIDHIQKMWDCLKPNGTIVCIMSNSWITGSQRKQVEFRAWLHRMGTTETMIASIPSGTFEESGTMVGGTIVIIHK